MGNKKSKQKGCFDETWICNACKRENDSFGKYSEKCKFCDQTFLGYGYINNSLVSNTLNLSRNEQQKMIIYGFYRINCDESNINMNITMDIIKIIIKYWDILQLFVNILCTKDNNKYDGKVSTEDEINIFQMFSDDELNCVYCKNEEMMDDHDSIRTSLTWKESCKQSIFPYFFHKIEDDDKLIGYKNNINKYLCEKCDHYNIFNVKSNLLEFKESDKTGDIYDKKGETYNINRYWVSPLFEDMRFYKFKSHFIKSKDVKPKWCPMCDNPNIMIIGSDEKKRADYMGLKWQNANYLRNIFYCNSCQLYIYKADTVHTAIFQE